MKFIFSIIFLLMAIGFSAQEKDDSVRCGFYTNIDIALHLGYQDPKVYGKWVSTSEYTIEQKPYEIRTPNAGLGFYAKGRRMFFRTDFSYWYGRKDASIISNYYSYNIEGSVENHSGPPPFKPGDTIYTFKEVATGKVNLHYIDWNVCFGVNVWKRLTVIGGIRVSSLANYSFTGSLDRNGWKSIYNGWYGPPTKIDTAYVHYEGKQMKSTKFQTLGGDAFWDVGIVYFYSMGKRKFFNEININVPMFQSEIKRPIYLTVKTAFQFFEKTKKGKRRASKKFEGVKIY